jgi:hypothetical protein
MALDEYDKFSTQGQENAETPYRHGAAVEVSGMGEHAIHENRMVSLAVMIGMGAK